MSLALLLDAGLCLMVLAAALSAISGRDLFGSIAFYIIYGILIALAWMRLDAVDVALAEAAIGAGLTGVLLISAWSMLKQRGVPEEPRRPSVPARLLAGFLSGGVAVLVAATILGLPHEEAGLIPLVRENIEASGVTNPVTAVLLNFRAYDTLLESIVLVVALVAIWSLTPREFWGGVPGLRQHARPDGVLVTFGRMLPPLGLLVGVYLVWAGSSMPGGAFQAATVLAAVWLLLVMAGIQDEPPVSSLALRGAIVIGPALFLGIGAAGAFLGAFLGFPEAYATALILLIEYVLTVSLAIMLALLVAGVPRRNA
jgi:multisubunit Na+/H+ antiporter MnhB subunit